MCSCQMCLEAENTCQCTDLQLEIGTGKKWCMEILSSKCSYSWIECINMNVFLKTQQKNPVLLSILLSNIFRLTALYKLYT